tara:strand:- start:1069 stop:4152 length:3084 start_codon:yes stop_codon:yes gene_type:complete
MSIFKTYINLTLVNILLLSILLSNSGGPSANVANNAPSYNNCTQCHYASVNPTGGSVSINGLPSSGYIPGESYSLTVKVIGTEAHERGYGYQMASQVGNDNSGTFSLGSSSQNSALNGNRVQHSTRTVSGEWIVEWLAPSSDVGDITFSVSGVATGGTSGNGGDQVYTAALVVPSSTPQETDLFISEYIEGSSSNKAIEIFNPTGSAVDLSNYSIKQAAGGSGWGFHPDDGEVPGFIFPLNGSLDAGDVFILSANQAINSIQAVADTVLGYPSVCHFAGDDAVGLFKNNVLIDVIGLPTVDPGASWDVAGESGGTKDHTLIRKPTVSYGNTDWASSAGTSAEDSEWIVEDEPYNSNLGYHIFGTGGANLSPIANAGSNQSVLIESLVTLDGSSSLDPDGTIESYLWSQTSGINVELSSLTEALVTFTAPSSLDSLSFTLTVTDNEGASSSATAYVKTIQGIDNTVFFSEWAEGTSSNKYIEIYNGTGGEIDLSVYKISACSNGCNTEGEWDFPDQVIFDAGTMVAAGDVFVLAHPYADQIILDQADNTSFIYMGNGNDAVGLVSATTGFIVDLIGDMSNSPPDAWDVAGTSSATNEQTIVRKPSVLNGNTDWATSAGTDASNSEWLVFDQNVWDNLGFHNQGVDAPSVTISSISPVFLTDQTEIEFSAEVTVPTGSVSSVVVKYGTNDQLVNEAEMYQDNGDIWAGTIPAQQGNIALQMRVFATSSEGVEGQSAVVKRVIASSSPSQIADLYSSQSSDELVTIKGIVTIGGSGLLHPTQTKAYVQDESGRGLQLFDSNLIDGLDRGDEVEVVGYTGLHETTYQIKDFEFRELSSGNDLPEPIIVSATQANSSDYEGTMISLVGTVTDMPVIANMTNLEIDNETNVVIWNTTGVDVSSLNIGYRGQFIGVGSKFGDNFQLLVCYDSDISTVVGIDLDDIIASKFTLLPAYPNPFNPITNISFVVDKPSEVSLKIFDVNGKLVQVINSKMYQLGVHNLQWNASNLSSGMYFIHMLNGADRHTQKVMLLK